MLLTQTRGGSRAAATFKMERFVIIINGFQPWTIITKWSILDVVTALDPPLQTLVTRLPVNFDLKSKVQQAASNIG